MRHKPPDAKSLQSAEGMAQVVCGKLRQHNRLRCFRHLLDASQNFTLNS
jgi:hypothetical protein